ncbi:unnamed protein product [Darwinula stevensoni]|uniref:Uncharacterized protein n=1 Tax=Darwinula stevensoni TaxID=69355 RepID=A0A7R9A427_9CRUS|nr:unnamed protein product [Darwinula stevensoni]CAG0882535.1 unnamed protein product [Darwinula stevensoni]
MEKQYDSVTTLNVKELMDSDGKSTSAYSIDQPSSPPPAYTGDRWFKKRNSGPWMICTAIVAAAVILGGFLLAAVYITQLPRQTCDCSSVGSTSLPLQQERSSGPFLAETASLVAEPREVEAKASEKKEQKMREIEEEDDDEKEKKRKRKTSGGRGKGKGRTQTGREVKKARIRTSSDDDALLPLTLDLDFMAQELLNLATAESAPIPIPLIIPSSSGPRAFPLPFSKPPSFLTPPRPADSHFIRPRSTDSQVHSRNKRCACSCK